LHATVFEQGASERRPGPPDRETIALLGCEIDRVDGAQAIARCDEFILSRRFHQHMAVNAAKLVALQDDARLREIVGRSDLVTADGQSVVWAARLLGRHLPERVAGIDLMHGLLALAERRRYRVYFLGAREDVLERALAGIRSRHPGLAVAGYRDGYFTEAEAPEVAAGIRDSRADILFVGISSPKKEYFLGRYGAATGVSLAMGVGGAIDVVAGVTRRAPRVLQRIGLEWLFRVMQEPRRLAGRYLTTNSRFLALVGGALVRPGSSERQDERIAGRS
jgi:N-acetylglucosaminyldiphosphoundecaprenol N-acetyl-beta-D-mannosaminyltransferase